jgi:hypothetical protein
VMSDSEFDKVIWNDIGGPPDLRLDFLEWWRPPGPDTRWARLASADGTTFDAWWDDRFLANPLGGDGLTLEVRGLVPPQGVRLDIPWQVSEVGWWIMARFDPASAARFATSGVNGCRAATNWVELLRMSELLFEIDDLTRSGPGGMLRPGEYGWRLIELLAPIGVDPKRLYGTTLKELARLTDKRLEPVLSLMAAWMTFVKQAPGPGPHTASSFTHDAVRSMIAGLRRGRPRYRRFEDWPLTESDNDASG